MFSFVPIVKRVTVSDMEHKTENVLLQPALKKKVGPRFYPYSNVYILLQSITDENARMMGFDAPTMRPEYMMKVLPVAPNTIRPMQEDFKTGKPMENDLTMMYSQVVRVNNQIKQAKQRAYDPGQIQTRMVGDLFRLSLIASTIRTQHWYVQSQDGPHESRREKRTIRAGILDTMSGYGSKKTIFRRRMNSKVVNNVIRS